MCEDCGLYVEPLELVRGWNSQSATIRQTETEKIKLIKYMTRELSLPLPLVEECSREIDRVSYIKNSTLKGRRKKSLMFACIFNKTRQDPESLRRSLKLTYKECYRGFELYENYIGKIGWTWKNFLEIKLKQIDREHLIDTVVDRVMVTRLGKINKRLAKCVYELCKDEFTKKYIDDLFNCRI